MGIHEIKSPLFLSTTDCCCCCFSTATVPLWECSQLFHRYHPSAQQHLRSVSLWFLPLVTNGVGFYHSVLLNCRFILTYAPASSGKFVLDFSIFHRSIMGRIDLLGCSPHISYHWFVCYWMLCCRSLGFLHYRIPAAVIWMLLWEVLVVVPCQMAL